MLLDRDIWLLCYFDEMLKDEQIRIGGKGDFLRDEKRVCLEGP